MNNNLKTECNFRSVGQGLFYTAILSQREKNNYKRFSFVYDCGSLSNKESLYREILDFKKSLEISSKTKKMQIDMIVLSHLHDDHINGLGKLLKNVEVGIVVMPYLSNEELYFCAAGATRLTKFTKKFYTDPFETLLNSGVKRVILTNSNENNAENEKFNSNNKVEAENESESDLVFHWSSKNVKHHRHGNMNVDILDISKSFMFQIDLKKFNWLFNFFNIPIEKSVVDKFNHIYLKFRKKYGNLSIEEIIANNRLRRELREVYEKNISSDLNRTSTVVSHEPVSCKSYLHANERPNYSFNSLLSIYDKYEHPWFRTATLLTGDIDFSENTHLINYIQKYTKNYFGIMSVPHHGAYNNWISSDWKELNPNYYIISYGLTNRYRHPDMRVIEEINNTHKMLRLVNENNNFEYSIFVE